MGLLPLIVRHFEGRMTEKSHPQSPILKATDFSTRNIIFKQKSPVRVFEMTRYLKTPRLARGI